MPSHPQNIWEVLFHLSAPRKGLKHGWREVSFLPASEMDGKDAKNG